MNWRKHAYLTYARWRGYKFPSLLKQYIAEYEAGNGAAIRNMALSRLLKHCRHKVPYYSELLEGVQHIDANPVAVLQKLPVLTKDLIRANFSRLQSTDNCGRNCEVNTSGGSTGEPVQLVQDDDYRDCSAALRWFSHYTLGCELGEPHVRLWGSERDLESGSGSRKAQLFNWLTHVRWMNAFRMSPEHMRGFIESLNRQRPCLVVAYAQAAYELAHFAEREQIAVKPQRAIVTSAGTLYAFMREKIRKVFGCEVYNLYGSREVSDIAWELPGMEGLWAPPWANYVEIVDDYGAPVPDDNEGNILVTCLMNHAMPLIRYWIGDRGALMPSSEAHNGAQVLTHVSGRTVDMFRRNDQTLVDGEYFTHLLYFRPWVGKFQVLQKSHERLLFKVVSANGRPAREELCEITERSRLVMGSGCRVDFEFVDELPPQPSGKFRYTISEVGH
jgi:phenylacetate-CoA ligase